MQSETYLSKDNKENIAEAVTNADKKTIRFIVNPVSGRRPHDTIAEIIRSVIDRKRFAYEIILTESAGHARKLSREAVKNEIDIVVAVGGDGTINEVASEIIFTDTVLGIIPLGSGNGLARHLGIPISAKRAIQLINKNNTASIDTASINGKSFVSIAGIGFDALVAREFSKNKKRGFFSYLRIITNKYGRYKPKKYNLKFDNGLHIKTHAFFISFANSNQFGYSTSIAPQAKLDDGKLDVCIVQKPRVFMMPVVANLLFLKQIHKSPLVEIISTSGLTVKRKERNVNLDGEALKMKKKLNIKVNPLSLKIIIPEQ
jgi:YegS/Rv2252/BmrU family lipid kinase